MRTFATHVSIVVLLLGFATQADLSAQFSHPVRIEAGSRKGQGLLRREGNGCFVITPGHVVKDIGFADVITTQGERIKVQGRLTRTRAAAFHLDAPPALPCERWTGVNRDRIRLILRDRRASFKYRYIDGRNSVRLMPVRIVSVPPISDSVDVELVEEKDRFPDDASGGQLLAGNMVIGILETVDDGRASAGFTLLDAVDTELRPVFPIDPATSSAWEFGPVTRLDSDYRGLHLRYVMHDLGGFQPYIDVGYLGSYGTNFRLRGEPPSGTIAVDDTANAQGFSLSGGVQLLVPIPVKSTSLSLAVGAVLQRESTEAHQLRYVDSWNYGVTLGGGLLTMFNERVGVSGTMELQYLQISPTREVKVKIVDHSRTGVMARIGIYYLP
jgi:hypothetical protein